MKAHFVQVLGLSLLATAGCGESASPDYAPPIATLHGYVTGSASGISHPLRVALIWESPGRNFVVQETGIQPTFPARFELLVTQPPPEEAMHGFPVLRVAFGKLAVYEDLNGNGRFDLIPADAYQRIDRLLSDGVGGRIHISYYEGSAEEVAKVPAYPIAACAAGDPCPQQPPYTVLPGFNLRLEHPGLFTGNDCLESPCRVRASAWIARGADINLPLGEATFSTVQCQDWRGLDTTAISTDGHCPGNVVPPGWGILCHEGISATEFYALSPQDPNLPICTYSSQQCRVTRNPADPLPPGWPCQ